MTAGEGSKGGGVLLEVALSILEVVEVGVLAGAGGILAADASECAGEVRGGRGAGLVGGDAGVEGVWEGLPGLLGESPGEEEAVVIDIHSEVDDWGVLGYGDGR